MFGTVHPTVRRAMAIGAAALLAVAGGSLPAVAGPLPAGTLLQISRSAAAPPSVDGIGGPATCATLPFAVRGIAVSSSGTVYFTDANRVLKVDAATGTLQLVAGTGVAAFSGDGGSAKAARLSHPAGLWLDARTGLYIADTGNNRVRRVFNGIITTVAGNGHTGTSRKVTPATSAVLPLPTRVQTNGTGGLRVGNAAGGAFVNLTTRTFTPTTDHPRAFTVDPARATYGTAPPTALVRRWATGTSSPTAFAGMGAAHIGSGGDGGPASLASLSASVNDLGSDAAGNIYLADGGNGAIRVVDHATRVINKVTAVGVPWQNLSAATAMAVTPAGDLYVSAFGGTQILRRDHVSGAVTLVVGSGSAHGSCTVPIGTVALPGTVAAITHDGFANVIAVIDLPGAVNPEIWRISTAGLLTKLEANHAATGSSGDGGPVSAATFVAVTDVAVDTPGNIYLNDTGAGRVRRIDHTTGVITTVAGNGTIGSTGDGGPATSASIQGSLAVDSVGNLFLSGGGKIRLVDHTSHIITTVAGGGGVVPTAAGIPANTALIAPGLSAIDPAGSVFFMSGNRLFRFDPPVSPAPIGTVTLVAGNGSLQTSVGQGDGGLALAAPLKVRALAIGADENVYLASVGAIRRIGSVTHRIQTIYVFDPRKMLPGTWVGSSSIDALTLTGSDVEYGSSIHTGTGVLLDSEIRSIVDGANAPQNLTPR